MPRLSYLEAECKKCHRAVFVPVPTYRQSDLARFDIFLCRDCREALEAVFGGAVVSFAP